MISCDSYTFCIFPSCLYVYYTNFLYRIVFIFNQKKSVFNHINRQIRLFLQKYSVFFVQSSNICHPLTLPIRHPSLPAPARPLASLPPLIILIRGNPLYLPKVPVKRRHRGISNLRRHLLHGIPVFLNQAARLLHPHKIDVLQRRHVHALCKKTPEMRFA